MLVRCVKSIHDGSSDSNDYDADASGQKYSSSGHTQSTTCHNFRDDFRRERTVFVRRINDADHRPARNIRRHIGVKIPFGGRFHAKDRVRLVHHQRIQRCSRLR